MDGVDSWDEPDDYIVEARAALEHPEPERAPGSLGRMARRLRHPPPVSQGTARVFYEASRRRAFARGVQPHRRPGRPRSPRSVRRTRAKRQARAPADDPPSERGPEHGLSKQVLASCLPGLHRSGSSRFIGGLPDGSNPLADPGAP
jgi:hypothetical protein